MSLSSHKVGILYTHKVENVLYSVFTNIQQTFSSYLLTDPFFVQSLSIQEVYYQLLPMEKVLSVFHLYFGIVISLICLLTCAEFRSSDLHLVF